MLFRKDIKRCCGYCIFSQRDGDETMTCSKKGAVSEEQVCLLYRYDPCKRIPPKAKALDFSQYSDDDFKL